MRVLIIEDERKLAEAIGTGLEEIGCTAIIVHTGEAGLLKLHNEPFDVVLLDLMLPGASGMEALRTMRRDGYEMPVLILTSRGSIEDRVRADRQASTLPLATVAIGTTFASRRGMISRICH